MTKKSVWIAEKPSVALAFAEAMGMSGIKNSAEGAYVSEDGNTKITWGFGHLLRYIDPEEYSEAYKRWELSALPIIPEKWQQNVVERTRDQFFKVKKLLADADEAVLATDYDREGEVIGREILINCGFTKPVYRVIFSAMDKASLIKSIEDRIDGAAGMPLYYAGVARAQIDWLYGMNLTRRTTLLARRQGLTSVSSTGRVQSLSAGRVQSATLNIIVEREKEIESFTSQDHYQLQATFAAGDSRFKGNWVIPADLLDADKRLLTSGPATDKKNELTGKTATVSRCTASNVAEKPPLPFNLSTAQIELSNKFGFSASKTLTILQSLYETHKLTSYPRTSSRELPVGQLAELEATLESIKSMDDSMVAIVDSLDTSLRSDAWVENMTDAHYGLIPTPHRCDLSKLTEDELKVYRLIRDMFIVQFMPPAQRRKVALEIRAADTLFMANGSTLTSPGWMSYLQPAKEEDTPDEAVESDVPELETGTEVKFDDLQILSKKTQPPRYYTEATLLATMTNCGSLVKDPELKRVLKATSGIGTDATRASIIDTLFNRNYVVRKGKQLRSTELGKAVLKILPDEVKSVGNTAYIEQKLDSIANRQLSLETFRSEIEEQIRVMFAAEIVDMDVDKVIPKCPDCGNKLRRIARKSPAKGDTHFWGCQGYPDCKSTFNDKKGKPEFRKVASKGKGAAKKGSSKK